MITNPLTETLIPWSVVRRMIGVGRTTVWRLRKAGMFPQPRMVGHRQVWLASEIAAWQAGLPTAGAT